MKIGDVRPLPLENCDFSISVTTDGLCIAAEDRRGLLNGYMALLRQIQPICLERGSEQFFIPCGEIYGKPAVKKRMVHLCVFPETTLPFITKFVRLCGVLNYTHLVLEFWGTLHFDCLKELSWPQALTKEQIKPIIKEANDMGLEIIPMFNHLGHAAAHHLHPTPVQGVGIAVGRGAGTHDVVEGEVIPYRQVRSVNRSRRQLDVVDLVF